MHKSLNNIITVAKLYLLSICSFGIFRIILFFANLDKIKEVDGSISFLNIIQSFIMGIRFDIVISGYILIIPFIILTVQYLIKKNHKLTNDILGWVIYIFYLPAFIISAADIPFFNQFFTRFNINAFQWTESPLFVLKMIIQEPKYWLFALPLVGIGYTFFIILRKIITEFTQNKKEYPSLPIRIIVSILGLAIIFIGIRGRLEEKSPIRIGTAYFCNNQFLNQLGLNPVFVFIRSAMDKNNKRNKDINLMDNKAALELVKQHININSNDLNNPILRYIKPDSISNNRPNIVLVIMESMSSDYMIKDSNGESLTPTLNNLSNNGIYFNNIYTAGIHTHNGIFSTLFSFPAILDRHSMRESDMLQYNGLSYTLKKMGYSTTFLTTHDGQFDNVEGFLRNNFFDEIYTQNDYPSDKVLSTLGVPDDYLFDYAINTIDNRKSHKPFFVAMMSGSNHGPFVVPDYFKSKYTDIKQKVVNYADWSIGKLINTAKTKEWFSNTIFVFIADHGAVINPIYEMPISYHHSPMIFYAPNLFRESKVISNVGGQIDLFPTLMGLIKAEYFNNTLGIDLSSGKRPYMFFSSDNIYGAISDSLYLIVKEDGSKGLFKYRTNDTKNYYFDYKSIAEDMLKYTHANIQTAYYLNKNKMQYKR